MAETDPVIAVAIDGLKALCEEHRIEASHGLAHALRVLDHADKALSQADGMSEDRKQAVRLAALLHDADDRKLFKKRDDDRGLKNAEQIMEQANAKAVVIGDAIRMIELVSCSKNGNSVPHDAEKEPELLWPRWADRLEATGEIGIIRCWQYNREVGAPLVLPDTPCPKSEEEVWAHATNQRFELYQKSGGKSNSMLDHYYDKLLRVACPPAHFVKNGYLEREMADRAQPLVQVCLQYGLTGVLPLNEDIISEKARLVQ
eukprot:Skav201033  [mRNA]  locus=scaffold3386:156139:156915:+ [translate_table: standard]